jgi:hypothetical protein
MRHKKKQPTLYKSKFYTSFAKTSLKQYFQHLNQISTHGKALLFAPLRGTLLPGTVTFGAAHKRNLDTQPPGKGRF